MTAPLLDLTLVPDPAAGLATQLLHGEPFTVYEERPDGLAWGQSETDGYVGYVAAAGLGPATAAEGRRVTALASHRYAASSLKARTTASLPFHALVAAGAEADGFVALADGGFVPAPHLAAFRGDAAEAAAGFLGAPYLWGGRSAAGLDCSALVQLSLAAAGVAAPRDSDMQAALLGEALPAEAPSQRGDLVFWRGHVGILADPGTLLHANAHHMAVAREPLAAAAARIEAAGGGPVTLRRRPPVSPPARAGS
ncbi:NlpC/P60 family protein [Amaricoccus sp.]|uniref:C40 family peptidase n=1 Tax=Amaricoccus sp. TaxID=1872485 RepID=UPI0025C1C3C4|nr:NlpC/P60 family protein [Amaricoccus sp.]